MEYGSSLSFCTELNLLNQSWKSVNKVLEKMGIAQTSTPDRNYGFISFEATNLTYFDRYYQCMDDIQTFKWICEWSLRKYPPCFRLIASGSYSNNFVCTGRSVFAWIGTFIMNYVSDSIICSMDGWTFFSRMLYNVVKIKMDKKQKLVGVEIER